MLAYVTIGVDDMQAARRFYDALLLPLGYRVEEYHGDLSYIPDAPDLPQGLPEFYVKTPFDGGLASAGNGTMFAFDCKTQAQVRALHAAALAAGGKDEGQPGFRASYGPQFFVGYLRDRQGNKIALFTDNPDEPGRNG